MIKDVHISCLQYFSNANIRIYLNETSERTSQKKNLDLSE